MHKGIAVIGDRDSVNAFKAAGADVYQPLGKEQTGELIKTLAKQNYAVIFITEDKAAEAADLINQYKSKPYPIILPIPSAGGSSGLGMRGLKYNIEKAIGMDIVFGQKE